MSTIFQVKIAEVMKEAIAEKSKLDGQWKPAREVISFVLRQAEQILIGAKFKDSNGDGLSLTRLADKLEFNLDRKGRQVIRTSTRETAPRYFDLDKVDAAKIEAEVEDFVRVIYSDS
jgi:hypothetical protein